MSNDLLVVGVGNVLRGDDGVGPKLVAELKFKNSTVEYLIVTDLFSLIDIVPQYRRVMIIDAVRMQALPGTVKLFSPQDAILQANSRTSTHGFGLAELIKLLAALAIATDLKIIGIQVGDIEFGQELSQSLQERWEEIVTQVARMVSGEKLQ